MSEEAAEIELVDVQAGYGRAAPVLRGFSVAVPAGSIVCLVGPNGAGKSTVLKVASGLLRPRSGRLLVGGRDVTGLGPQRMLASGVALVLQGHSVFREMTVEENVRLGAYTLKDKAKIAERLAFVKDIFPVVAERWTSLAGLLSGGQQKQVEFARSLMVDPTVVLLDEPAGGVNPALLDRIGTLVRELNAEGRTFVIVEHNMDLVMSISDHIVVFDRGRPIAEGPPSMIRTDERVLGAYLGV